MVVQKIEDHSDDDALMIFVKASNFFFELNNELRIAIVLIDRNQMLCTLDVLKEEPEYLFFEVIAQEL